MAESSTQSMTMAASPETIMDTIADFGAYPQWAASIKTVEILQTGANGRGSRVRFVLDAGLIKDTYELDYQWADDGLSVTWDLVSAQMQKAQHGSYLLRPTAGRTGESGTAGRTGESGTADLTEVTYSLSVDLSIPLIGPLRRKAERTIMDTALKELRKRVEAA
ncbi:MAG TPA: SRPBCC family protein [Nakamurella sp.]